MTTMEIKTVESIDENDPGITNSTLSTIGCHSYIFKKIINDQECMGKPSLGYI